jgi:hypothetical protein
MMDDNKISSVDEFLKIIFQKTTVQRNDKVEPNIYWFRGESSINFKTPLVPNGYRVLADSFKNLYTGEFISENIKQLERNISAEFDRKALPFINSKRIQNTHWNRYFLMQHYQIYTRLLDWTENALLALFFAAIDYASTDASVWILKPFLLNNFSIQTLLETENKCYIIPPISNDETPRKLLDSNGLLSLLELTRRYLRMDFNSKEGEKCSNIYYPLAIYPTYLDERMAAQKACFTIFGNKIDGLLTIPNCKETIIDSIIIDGKSKTKIMKELLLIGIDYNSVFPDSDGLGKSIMYKYRDNFFDNREIIPPIFDSINKEADIPD